MMINTTLKLAITLCLLFLSACNASHNIIPFTAEAADPEQAAVYVYRPSAMPNAMYSPDLYINDEFRLSIKNGTNTRLTLAPGEYKFSLQFENNFADNDGFSLTLEKGKNYYIAINTSLKIKSAINYEPYRRSFNLVNVDESRAINEIADCCINTKQKASTETVTDKKTATQGFSIDKTQNPFSH